MSHTITYNGVPVGTVELTEQREVMSLAVTPFASYESIRPIVRHASEALADVALARESRDRVADTGLALERGATLGRALELRDATGALVATDFIELTEWSGGSPEVAAIVRFRLADSRVAATEPPADGSGGAHSDS